MHLHILGICGTFMGGLAAIAREAGHTVTGCDANVYPPMSEQLSALGIELIEGYEAAQLDSVAKHADVFVIGNALSRGNPLLEAILDSGRRYTSGPQWLSDAVLREKWVLAVAGTHGKTTTTALLAWILDQAGLDPGFLIGGVAIGFGVSARLGDGPFFVIEADEYDTAFSDKRSKFVHYRPRTAILNNLEYDHSDIFPDLAAIETQFHHLVRTIPRRGRLIVNGSDDNLQRVLAHGCWSEVERFRAAAVPGNSADWTIAADGAIKLGAAAQGTLSPFVLGGQHNRLNALAASLEAADLVFCYAANLSWDAAAWLQPLGGRVHTSADLAALTGAIAAAARPGDHIVIMSNGAFGGIHDKLLAQLANAARKIPSASTGTS